MMSDDEIGYRKPPKHARFKPGQSGNPKGRPKGGRNFKTDLMATLKAPVRVTKDGKPKTLSTQEAILYRLREKALKGEARAIDRLVALALAHNNEELPAEASQEVSAADAAMLEVYHARYDSGVLNRSPAERGAESKPKASKSEEK